MNIIELRIDKTLTMLVGNDFGRTICESQINPNVDNNQENVIVIPETVNSVAISFIEGLLKALSNQVKRDEFYKYFSIKATASVENKFRNVILMSE